MGRGKEELLRRQRDGREVKERRNEGHGWFEKLEERDRENQKRERWIKIGESKFNRWYQKVKGGVPKYLREGWGESR